MSRSRLNSRKFGTSANRWHDGHSTRLPACPATISISWAQPSQGSRKVFLASFMIPIPPTLVRPVHAELLRPISFTISGCHSRIPGCFHRKICWLFSANRGIILSPPDDPPMRQPTSQGPAISTHPTQLSAKACRTGSDLLPTRGFVAVGVAGNGRLGDVGRMVHRGCRLRNSARWISLALESHSRHSE